MKINFDFNNEDFVQEFNVEHDEVSPEYLWLEIRQTGTNGNDIDGTLALHHSEAITLANALQMVANHIKENFTNK